MIGTVGTYPQPLACYCDRGVPQNRQSNNIAARLIGRAEGSPAMTAVHVSLVAIAVWLALNTLCLATWLLRMLLRRTSGLRKTEEAGPVTDQRSPSQLQLFDDLPLRAETAPTKPTSWDSSLVPSSQPEGPCGDGHHGGHQLPRTATHGPG